MSKNEAREQHRLAGYARRMQRHTEAMIRFPVGTVIGSLEVVGYVEPKPPYGEHGRVVFRGQNSYGVYTWPFADYVVLSPEGLEQLRERGYVYDSGAFWASR